MRNYGRLVSSVDDCVGLILEALDETGLASNTIVVFASDNGMLLGSHGMNSKAPAYEESIRIPLLLRLPTMENRGTVRPELVLNIDLAPTFLDYAGVEVPDNMQGLSLRPLLSSEDNEWRESFVYEFNSRPDGVLPDTTALRKMDFKLITFPDHPEWTEMYDLIDDPRETNNLASDPDHAAKSSGLRRSLDSMKFTVCLTDE